MKGLAALLTLEQALEECAHDFPTRVFKSGLPAVARAHAGQTRRRFETKTDPYGRPWRAWSEGYAKTRRPEHSLLVDEGDLLRSLDDGNSIHREGGDVAVGTDVAYAPKVQDTRPFMGIEKSRDLDELQATLDRWSGKALNRYGLA